MPRKTAPVHEIKVILIEVFVFFTSSNSMNSPMNNARSPVVTCETISKPLKFKDISARKFEIRE